MDKALKVTAIIVAAGTGTRFGGTVRKQFMSIHEKPVLQHTLERFQACPDIDAIVVVAPQADCTDLQHLIAGDWKIGKLRAVAAGGSARHYSVQNGMAAVVKDTGYVAIHDGVRPCIRVDLISRVVQAAREHGAAIPAIPPRDTIKVIHHDRVEQTLDRSRLVQVQTPQVFRYDLLQAAFAHAAETGQYGTDDASLVELMGSPVFIVPGDEMNIKITSPQDLELAQRYLGMQ